MSNRKIYRKLAKNNGVTVKEVKYDMQEAINYAYLNTPNNGITGAYQNRIPRKYTIPTVDEFISYSVKEIKNKK